MMHEPIRKVTTPMKEVIVKEKDISGLFLACD